MTIDLTEFAEAINAARADGTSCIVATQGAEGVPDIGIKGSMMVFDQDHLAYWERALGQNYANLQDRPASPSSTSTATEASSSVPSATPSSTPTAPSATRSCLARPRPN